MGSIGQVARRRLNELLVEFEQRILQACVELRLVERGLGSDDGCVLPMELRDIDEHGRSGGLYAGLERLRSLGTETVGLKGSQLLQGLVIGSLGAAHVEIDAFQAVGHIEEEQGVAAFADVAELGCDFGAAAAAEGPGGVGMLGEELALDGAGWLDFGFEFGHELVKFLLLAGENDEILGGEAVGGGVAGGGGFALGGTGPGGAAGVGLIGGDLGGSGHGGVLSRRAVERKRPRRVRAGPFGFGGRPRDGTRRYVSRRVQAFWGGVRVREGGSVKNVGEIADD